MLASNSPVVYTVWYNSCVYESAARTISIHQTKAGAWKALRKMLWDKAVDHREQGLTWAGRDWMRSNPFEDCAYGLSIVPLLP
jgi:hypothetical protein